MVALPRLVIAAPSTGEGKTTVASGLMAALRLAGYAVSGHKVGPDYIDPGYHALATGRPGRNLDPHLVGEDRLVPLLLHGATGADVAIVEGVMGLYDGRLGTDGFASTAHVARVTRSPVVLVLDVGRMSRTAAAIAAGMAAYDDSVELAGVILNRTGSPRNDAEILTAMERTGLPVLGLLPRDEKLVTPSRHLGLVPAAERAESAALIGHLGAQVARHLDLDALLDVARGAPALDAEPWDPAASVRPSGGSRPVIAMAAGRAFTFRYAETEELLRAAGCDVVEFDPVTDDALPEGTQGIYLGGGFPQMYAAELTANRGLLTQLHAAAAAGIPIVAECAGLLYLTHSLDGAPMAGVLPATAAMSDRLTLRYPVATACCDSLLTRAGEQVTGHEFHRTTTEFVGSGFDTSSASAPDHSTSANVGGVDRPEFRGGRVGEPARASRIEATGRGFDTSSASAPEHSTSANTWSAAWEVDDTPTGFASETIHASYLHVHWAGHPQLAQRFADAARDARPHRDVALPSQESPQSTPKPANPLQYHGDSEVGDGLLDLAVNVYDGPRPAWLDRALHAAVDASAAYPDVSQARGALASRHARHPEEVLPTAGAAEAFALIAASQDWRRPVVIHPQFTEPHAALEAAGHRVTSVICRRDNGFRLEWAEVPYRADLVMIGNPTNPTGVLHPAESILALCTPGRVVVVDEAFMDAVPGEPESLAGERREGLVILRSLTKQWSIPGIRAGYAVGDSAVIEQLAARQTPWSVSTPALAAMIATSTDQAMATSAERAIEFARWRAVLEAGLTERGFEFIAATTPFVLARLGPTAHSTLRQRGIAVRRADTFPGLDSRWVRIAVRPPETTLRFFAALDESS